MAQDPHVIDHEHYSQAGSLLELKTFVLEIILTHLIHFLILLEKSAT